MKHALFLALFLFQIIGYSQSANVKTCSKKGDDTLLLTIFLKHDQSMNLNEIEKIS